VPKRRLYREHLKKSSDNATSFYMRGREVEQGLILYVTTASCVNEDKQTNSIAFGILVGDEFYPMEEEATVGKGIAFLVRKTHHFIGGEQPVFLLEGTTVGNSCKAHFEGYYEEV